MSEPHEATLLSFAVLQLSSFTGHKKLFTLIEVRGQCSMFKCGLVTVQVHHMDL